MLRNRLGDHDFYGYLEDDWIWRDPWLFQKLACFDKQLGDDVLFQPKRYKVGPLGRARCGVHGESATIAEALVKMLPRDEQLDFQSACPYALAAGAAASDQGMVSRKAHGWSEVASLETDPALAPIRKDPEFSPLLSEFPRPESKMP